MNPEHGHDGGTGRRDEAALSTALRDAAGDLVPPTPALVSGGLARGKRMRATRRAQIAVAAVAVVALGGGGLVALGDLGGGGGTTVAAPGSSVPDSPPPSPAPAPVPQTLVLTAGQATDALRQLLPAGATVEDVSATDPGVGTGNEVAVTLRVDPDGRGPGEVTLLISSGNTELICFDDTGLNASCDLVTQADGSRLRLERNWEYPATPSTEDGKAGVDGAGAQVWSATFQRDGLRIHVGASSAAAEKTPATREAPALTPEQLQAIATAPVWTTLVTPQTLPLPAKGGFGAPAASPAAPPAG
ncbi:hypothetical protein LO772_09585 [Yinghuangia sp. ASG 101]|uniref:hypothetical protein n=1 Tax=Yinghuangia sp. ASG 101 TaxID=2896848 RepID=UPI001E3A50CC|nr:hypothetical protein [Yinghuangia sp. ASG 101]UGQ13816.1 hypothetical protein LO772_09585 [Yinghuangia sp. ASG 101]